MRERVVRRLLAAWLLLLGGVLLAQRLALAQVAYQLFVIVAVASPVVAGLLLWLVGLGLREAWHRWQRLRRARKWRRPPPPWNPDEDWGYPGSDAPVNRQEHPGRRR